MTRTPTASTWARTGVLLAVAGALAACGISADQDVTRIPADEIGAIANTTTTTTTTTTVPPTVPPTSTPQSLPPVTTTTTTTTTTLPAVELTPVTLYFARRGDTESLRRVSTLQVGQLTLDDLILLLSDPRQDILADGLTTAVPTDLVVSTELQSVHTVVDFDPAVFDRMTDAEQNQAIAQLVLTLTAFVSPVFGPVGPLEFRYGGQPISVLIPGEGASEVGEPVSYRQFERWVETSTGEPTATAVTNVTEPPGTVPPETAAPG